ncbi:uncharacterized protein LOC119963344 isoform X1 [Scyliorhinus canicula]|uniref:uncharacterized protein LOC119963344 isoform X1 n=2 Tax=Scyliorhinus canicula TaxID=7830 RepID=UPI0018F336A9|nr:uncharacterized protein LOC119963344 isoform X1 [Scyliorhinus canicula]
MNSKITVTVIAFFILYLSPTQSIPIERTIVEPHCQCLHSSSELISPEMMRNIEIFPITSNCSRVEVTITLKNETIFCVNPEASWLKPMINRTLQQHFEGTHTIMRNMQPRCKCIDHISHGIDPNTMKNIEIIPITSHCSRVQVIITLKNNRTVCVNPEASWMKPMVDSTLQQHYRSTPTTSTRVQSRCQCINYISHPIHPHRMKDIEILPTSSRCSQVEVIITLKDGTKVCVDPEVEWLKKLIDKIMRRN